MSPNMGGISSLSSCTAQLERVEQNSLVPFPGTPLGKTAE